MDKDIASLLQSSLEKAKETAEQAVKEAQEFVAAATQYVKRFL